MNKKEIKELLINGTTCDVVVNLWLNPLLNDKNKPLNYDEETGASDHQMRSHELRVYYRVPTGEIHQLIIPSKHFLRLAEEIKEIDNNPIVRDVYDWD